MNVALPLSEDGEHQLRRALCDCVDELKGTGWAPEKVVVEIKRIAVDAGITGSDRRAATLPTESASEATRKGALIDHLVKWSIQRYYAQPEGDGPPEAQA